MKKTNQVNLISTQDLKKLAKRIKPYGTVLKEDIIKQMNIEIETKGSSVYKMKPMTMTTLYNYFNGVIKNQTKVMTFYSVVTKVLSLYEEKMSTIKSSV